MKYIDTRKYEQIDLFRMPFVVIQPQNELNEINHRDYYIILWDGPNDRIGSYRVDHLKNNNAKNKRHLMTILRAAYNYASDGKYRVRIANFDDALAFCKHMGIKIIHSKVIKGKCCTKWLVQ